MSAYIKMDTEFHDGDCLVASLRSLGYAPEVHAKPVHLTDYMGKVRPEMAEIVISRRQVGSLSNEIGFQKQTDGTYMRISSEYDNGAQRLDPKKLKLKYAETKVLKLGAERGLKLVERIPGQNGASRFVFEQAKIR